MQMGSARWDVRVWFQRQEHTPVFFFNKKICTFSKMYKIFGCRVEDFPGFLEKIPGFGVKSADVSEILKIFEVFYKNIQNFEKQ